MAPTRSRSPNDDFPPLEDARVRGPAVRVAFRSILVGLSALLAPRDASGQSVELSRERAAQLVAEARAIDELQLAPDGSAVIYSVSAGSIATNQYTTSLYMQRLTPDGNAAGTPVELSRRGPSRLPASFSALWCSPGDCVSYFDDASDPAGRSLVRHNLSTGRTTRVVVRDTATRIARPRVTRIGENYKWSPSGRMLAFTASAFTSLLDPRRGISLPPGRSWQHDRDMLFVLDVASGIVTQVTPDSLALYIYFDWAPDGSALVFAARNDLDADLIWGTDLFVVDRATRAVRTLVSRPGADLNPKWSPDGRWISFVGRGKQAYGAGWLSVVPAQGGEVTVLQRQGGSDPFLFTSATQAWTPDSRAVFFTAPYRMNFQLYRAFLPTSASSSAGASAELMLEDVLPFNQAYSLSADARRLAMVRQVGAHAPEVYIAAISTRGISASRRLTSVNDMHSFRDRVRTDTISWRSPDGKFLIGGVLLTPKTAWHNGRITRPLPTLVNVKWPGAVTELEAAFTLGQFAARGYAVLVAQMRGRNGNGLDFLMGLEAGRSYVRLPLDDVLAGVDLLVRRGIADSAHLGLFGLSQGGNHTSAMITMTHRFKAAVAVEAVRVHQLDGSIIDSNSPDWRERIPDEQGNGDVYDTLQLARLISEGPAFRLDRVRTPLHIQVGAHSAAAEGAILFGGLQRFGVPSEFVVYDEGHGFTRPAAIVDHYSRIGAWFDYWLRGIPYPDAQRQRTFDEWRKQNQRATR